MAEGPKITRNDDGLFISCEFDAHYVSDEDAQRIRGYIDQLETKNAKLQEELARWERLTACINLIDEYPVTQFKPKDLKRENNKLREQLAEWKRVAESKQDIIDHMRDANAENAKLRELVQDIYGVMWACAEQRCTHRHDGCFRVHGNHGDICVSERCWYEDRMSELGIEV